MCVRFACLLVLSAALLAGSARAGDADALRERARATARSEAVAEEARKIGEVQRLWRPIESPAAQIGFRAEDVGLPRLRLYARSDGFAAGQRHALANVEGGAGVRLLRRLCLTGSYRLLGYDLSSSIGQIDPDTSGPFLGLTIDF